MRKSSLERHLDCNKINKPLTTPQKTNKKPHKTAQNQQTKPQNPNKQKLFKNNEQLMLSSSLPWMTSAILATLSTPGLELIHPTPRYA